MKKLLLIFLLISSLRGYNQDDYNKLVNEDKDLIGADLTNINIKNKNLDDVNFYNANLSGSCLEKCSLNNANLDSTNLKDVKLIDCEFQANNLSQIYDANKLILIRTTLFDGDDSILRNLGAFIPNKGVVCNSDLHVYGNDTQESEKQKHLSRMVEITNDYKNNIKAIVIPGDMCDWGDQKDWDKFVDVFYNPLKNTGKEVLITIGNHDRWQREGTLEEQLNVWGRALLGLGSVAVEEVKDLYNDKIYYKKYVDEGMDIISLGECPTMTNEYNDGAISWYQNLSHLYPEILFFHYDPTRNWSIGWWTTGEEPRPTNEDRGRNALNYFHDSIKHYKDDIVIMITGHFHDTFFETWNNIPVVNVGGKERFAVCHFYVDKDQKINNCIAVELVHYDSQIPSVFYYPHLINLGLRELRIDLLKHIYRTCLQREPDQGGLENYLDNWYKKDEFSGIEYEIKNSVEGRPISLRNLYLKYLNREPDQDDYDHYLGLWDEKGLNVIEQEIKNSAEARTIIIRELYLKCLEREADDGGINTYLNNWDLLGGESGIEYDLKNSIEGRPITLRNLYQKYLEREPSQDDYDHYLGLWDSIGGSLAIEDEIKNSTEGKTVAINNLYLKCLEREADNDGFNHYMNIWDSIGGASGIEYDLKNSLEGRPITLRNLYQKYLERDPDQDGLDHYLNNWDSLGGSQAIEEIIKNSEEARTININNVFETYLSRQATEDEKNYYLKVWDYINGSHGVQEEVLAFYS
ncbi:hypothetical protein GF385_02345 [Candidatus Dependentiae bacterium]|nr:hypothetical protein [Candidatus Dependentiae bacterium]